MPERPKVLVVKPRGAELLPADVFEALRAVGLIWRDGDDWRMADVEMEAFPELAICDFCNTRPCTWYIEATPFPVVQVGPVTMNSTADWMACEACGTLIAAGDRAGLLRRTLAYCRARVDDGGRLANVLIAQRHMIDQFWRHYRAIRRYATPYREAPHE